MEIDKVCKQANGTKKKKAEVIITVLLHPPSRYTMALCKKNLHSQKIFEMSVEWNEMGWWRHDLWCGIIFK